MTVNNPHQLLVVFLKEIMTVHFGVVLISQIVMIIDLLLPLFSICLLNESQSTVSIFQKTKTAIVLLPF